MTGARVLESGDMSEDNLLNVLPPLVQSGRIDELIDTGRTLSMSVSPLDNSVATFVTADVRNVSEPSIAGLHMSSLSRVPIAHEHRCLQNTNPFISSQQMLILHLRGDSCVISARHKFTSDPTAS